MGGCARCGWIENRSGCARWLGEYIISGGCGIGGSTWNYWTRRIALLVEILGILKSLEVLLGLGGW